MTIARRNNKNSCSAALNSWEQMIQKSFWVRDLSTTHGLGYTSLAATSSPWWREALDSRKNSGSLQQRKGRGRSSLSK